MGKLKRFKRIALRCEKTAQNYHSFIALNLTFILVKSVHTAWEIKIFERLERSKGPPGFITRSRSSRSAPVPW